MQSTPLQTVHLLRTARQTFIMGCHHGGLAVLANQISQELVKFFARLPIQVSGGLIGKKEGRGVQNGTRNRHALLFSS